jgi:hypothetical protein
MNSSSEQNTGERLVGLLNKAGVNCPELRAWVACSEGKKDQCSECCLTEEALCDEELVTVLVDIIVRYVAYTDEVLQQRDYWKARRDEWKGISSNLADLFMERDRKARFDKDYE